MSDSPVRLSKLLDRPGLAGRRAHGPLLARRDSLRDAGWIEIGRRLVVEYSRDPANFQAALRERQAKDAYQRGLFLMNQGLSRIDDAIRSLEVATLFDPLTHRWRSSRW